MTPLFKNNALKHKTLILDTIADQVKKGCVPNETSQNIFVKLLYWVPTIWQRRCQLLLARGWEVWQRRTGIRIRRIDNTSKSSSPTAVDNVMLKVLVSAVIFVSVNLHLCQLYLQVSTGAPHCWWVTIVYTSPCQAISVYVNRNESRVCLLSLFRSWCGM